ncbi:MAG TPA: Gfo/Idh/MocA family oxidoreductase [bacterium]|nr:Gfo/Idh/MocA family oxidoreductase [bacterium]
MGKTNKKLKIAVAGCGRQAWLAFFPWIKEHPEAELAAVADADEGLAEKSAAKFGAGACYSSWEEMVEKCDAEAMIITTPPWVHADPAVAAAERGMHVLCEKPMATTVEDCARMVEAAEKNGVILDVAHSLRFDPGYEKLKSLVKSGEIGRVYQLRATYDSWVPDFSKSPFKEIYDFGCKYRLFGSKDMGIWRMSDPRTNGGVYFDHGIHYVDMFRWITEERVVSASGVVQHVIPGRLNEDHASSLLRFESGACAYVQGSLCRVSARGSCDEGMLHGETGCIKYKMDGTWYVLGIPHLYNVHASVWMFGLPSFMVNQWMPVHVKYGKSQCMFKRQLDHFVAKVNGSLEPHPVIGESWACSGRDGMENVRIVHAVYESDRKNSETVKLD